MTRKSWEKFINNFSGLPKEVLFRSNSLFLHRKINDDPSVSASNNSKKIPLFFCPELDSQPPEVPPSGRYLGIELFKQKEHQYFLKTTPYKYFLSSGTTSENKSRSYFSKEGLNYYKAGSLKTFFEVLRQTLGENFWETKGYSLIPPTNAWPDSSLSQMVEWISEFLPLSYIDPHSDLGQITTNEPVWLFGTAFHFINLIDAGLSKPLPEGSLIIETGGSKGRSRELPRDEYYKLLEEKFSIQNHQIISEYGMCELASQAYDFIPKENPNKKRAFLFPSWIKLSVTKGLNLFERSGTGSLAIFDPLRIDYPWTLRTQDIATLNDNQSFNLISRIPGSILKGCSLLAEEVLDIEEKISPPIPSRKEKEVQRQEPNKDDYDTIKNFLSNSKLLNSISEEISSSKAGKEAIKDLKKSFPADFQGFIKAVHKSDILNAPKKWLFILPNNHSLAGFYPLIFAALSHKEITCRIPTVYAHELSPLNLLIQKINEIKPDTIKVISSDFRITQNTLPGDIEAILCYGEDHTINQIKKHVKIPVVGFGSYLSISFIDSQQRDLAKNIIRDAFSLGQRGCLSSRAVFLDGWSLTNTIQLKRDLIEEFQKFWQKDFSVETLTAIDCAELKAIKEGALFSHRENYNEALFPIFNKKHKEFFIEEVISPTPFVLPLVIINESLNNFIKKHTNSNKKYSIGLVSSKKIQEKNIFLPPFGQTQSPPWDGTHQGMSLFKV